MGAARKLGYYRSVKDKNKKIRAITQEELFYSTSKASPVALILDVELVRLMIRVRCHFLRGPNEHTADERKQFTPVFTCLRFNVNTLGNVVKQRSRAQVKKHTHVHTYSQPSPHMRLLHFLTRGKQEHYSWPGPHCFLTSSPREPADCALIFN